MRNRGQRKKGGKGEQRNRETKGTGGVEEHGNRGNKGNRGDRRGKGNRGKGGQEEHGNRETR